MLYVYIGSLTFALLKQLCYMELHHMCNWHKKLRSLSPPHGASSGFLMEERPLIRTIAVNILYWVSSSGQPTSGVLQLGFWVRWQQLLTVKNWQSYKYMYFGKVLINLCKLCKK